MPPPLTRQELEHWADSGATWRVVELTQDEATIDLCRCTGELEQRRTTSDPALLRYLQTHREANDGY